MVSKICNSCGCVTAGSYCPDCQDQRPTTTQRGLGYNHRLNSQNILANATSCAICGQPPTPSDPLTAGHIIPRKRGGTSTPDNLQPEHRSCNSSKGTTPTVA